jgi:hypothetical protein
MAKTITHTIKRPQPVDTITLELPHFCKHKDYDWLFYCITEEERVIKIIISDGGLISSSRHTEEVLDNYDLVNCTREEFIEAFAKVSDSFTKILPYDGTSND